MGVTAGWQGELGERPSNGELMFKPLIHQASRRDVLKQNTETPPAVLQLSLTPDLPIGIHKPEQNAAMHCYKQRFWYVNGKGL